MTTHRNINHTNQGDQPMSAKTHVQMADKRTGAPFTRWFRSARDAPFGVGPNEPTDPETAEEHR